MLLVTVQQEHGVQLVRGKKEDLCRWNRRKELCRSTCAAGL
jgi:hypothetical protein